MTQPSIPSHLAAWPQVAGRVLDQISQTPHLWNILRRIAEYDFRGEKQVIAHELAPLSDAGQRRFLDLGCGTGELAACFPTASYIGIDPSRIYIGFARRHRRGTFLVSLGEHLALQSACCDGALVLGVLHHLPDATAQAAMRELHRVLRPGAVALVIEDIPPPDLWNPAGHLLHWLDRGSFIRQVADYQALFGPGFHTLRTYTMRSGICDYGVHVLRRLVD